ncbi:hypothetical protein FAZ69_00580 [Trinickia terrae]|uniref:Uncharacterized protein n=1 Tax=Trinickia terrae TaxID=2571161 RepID=A0A4U1IEV0_9BURK|nr:hypothetical protein [Trinickia terrae]TKC92233.1 hypothetical protein FAZ69_00580 [Trinickia terrae]
MEVSLVRQVAISLLRASAETVKTKIAIASGTNDTQSTALHPTPSKIRLSQSYLSGFAAADCVQPDRRSRTLSFVMADGVFAGLTGPQLVS